MGRIIKMIAALWPFYVIVVVIGCGAWALSRKPAVSETAPTMSSAERVPDPPIVQTVTLTPKGRAVKTKHPSWSNDVCNTIADHNVYIGMTAEQVKAAWGRPHRVNSTIGANGTREQWVMHDSAQSDYVYFENGVMTSLQRSR